MGRQQSRLHQPLLLHHLDALLHHHIGVATRHTLKPARPLIDDLLAVQFRNAAVGVAQLLRHLLDVRDIDVDTLLPRTQRV